MLIGLTILLNKKNIRRKKNDKKRNFTSKGFRFCQQGKVKLWDLGENDI